MSADLDLPERLYLGDLDTRLRIVSAILDFARTPAGFAALRWMTHRVPTLDAAAAEAGCTPQAIHAHALRLKLETGLKLPFACPARGHDNTREKAGVPGKEDARTNSQRLLTTSEGRGQ